MRDRRRRGRVGWWGRCPRRLELDGGVLLVEMVTVVEVLKCDRGVREGVEVRAIGVEEGMRGLEGVNKVGRPSDHPISQTVKSLEFGWIMEVAENGNGKKHCATGWRRGTHRRSMCSPRSRFVYAIFLLF